ncbi:calcium-binding protein [Microvirga roseola]|uniref:calcium-binding protein n=1 Tax=Microvirga roseola TaxID=2883126 RepID=UPI001E4F67D9|nr:calcium-binding protein [Microvirga roseola]
MARYDDGYLVASSTDGSSEECILLTFQGTDTPREPIKILGPSPGRPDITQIGADLFAVTYKAGASVCVVTVNVVTRTISAVTGDDTYHVDGADTVFEFAGAGYDKVVVTTSYTLTEGSQVEAIEVAALAGVTLTGNSAWNTLSGNAGNDALHGQAGNDVVDGGVGADVMHGGLGDDVFYVDNAGDQVVEAKGGGRDTVYASANFASRSSYEVDVIYATAGHSNLSLEGDKAANSIYGNAGKNKLWGGSGNDYLKGGSGKDTFVFDTKLYSAKTNKSKDLDKIADFKVKDDTIWLDNKYFKKIGSGSERKPKKLKKDFFTVGSEAEDRNDRIVYDKKKGVLYYDADSSGSKDAVAFAKLKKNLKMTYKDFYVI